MRRIEFREGCFAFALITLVVLPACSINVKKEKNGEDKQVDIRTPAPAFYATPKNDDPPEKLVAFYTNQLKKYGDILVCHTSSHFQVNADVKDSDHGSHALTCDSSRGNNVELKVGTKENQHIVAVEPDGKGSSFSLVYVRTHGKEAEI